MCKRTDIENNILNDANIVVELIMNEYYNHHQHAEKKNDYYCGITNNVENNLQRHHIDKHLIIRKCESAEVAAKVEEILGNEGFDIGGVTNGGNGGTEDSVYVYMFRKSDAKKS